MYLRLTALSAALLSAGYSLPAFSETTDAAAQPDAENTLDPVVVTATLSTTTVDASLSSVTVIDEETLREQQPQALSEVLMGQAGVDVAGNGSYGKLGSVFMRGASSDASVLLVDGVRLRTVTAGSAPWYYLPPQMLGRVEIVRGPRSSLYGSDAVGGVVQAFTRDSGDWFSVGGGSHNFFNIGAGTAGRTGNTEYALGVNHVQTEGVEIREGSDERGYDNNAGVVSLTQHVSDDASLGVFAFRAQGNSEYEGFSATDEVDTDYVIQVAGLKGEAWLTDHWQLRSVISEARDERENFTAGVSSSETDSRTRTANVSSALLFGQHEWIVGAEYLSDEVDGTTAYDESNRDNKAGFTQLLLNFGDFSAQASARHDDNDAYGSKVTGALALGYRFDAHHRVRASYGTAFKAPTFNDLYFPGFSNPLLGPESSETSELGFRGQYQTWFWDVAAYQTDVKDLIVYDPMAGMAVNTAKARIRGAELTAGVDIDRLRVQAAFSALKPEDLETDNIILRRAQRIGRLDVDYRLDTVSVGGSVRAQGHRYNDSANTQRLSGFALLDLRAAWQFSTHWRANVTVQNVLDKEYATARNFGGWDYLNAGRTAMLSVNYATR